MDKIVFENPLLIYIACFDTYVIKKSKGILELRFVKLGCWGYGKRTTPHSVKQCLDKTVSPHPTSRDMIKHFVCRLDLQF
jgi:hypothetical protein